MEEKIKMNKKDIITGSVVETRDKKQYICINDTLVSNTEFLNLYTYTDDLKSLCLKDSDIMKVFEKKDEKDLAPNNWFKNLKVIWKIYLIKMEFMLQYRYFRLIHFNTK